MSFSMKAQKPTGGSNVDWSGWAEHQIEVIGTQSKSRIAIISGLVDLGVQEREPFQVPHDEAKPDQLKALEEGRATLGLGKHPKKKTQCEMIVIPQKPAPQLAIVLDFPEIMLNYGKFFGKEGKDEFRPYRYVYGGEFNKVLSSPSSVTCMVNDKAECGASYAGTNMIAKFAVATGSVEGQLVEQTFPIEKLLGGVCTINSWVKVTEKGDNKYVNFGCKDPSPKHEMIPVPDVKVEPFGISFYEDNSEESLNNIKSFTFKALRETIKKATDYDTKCTLKPWIEALEGGNTSNQGGSEGNTNKAPSQAAQTATEVQSTPKVEASTDFEDFDDDFSFDD
jgi:hypothetical protein